VCAGLLGVFHLQNITRFDTQVGEGNPLRFTDNLGHLFGDRISLGSFELGMVRVVPHTVADVDPTGCENRVFVDEILVHGFRIPMHYFSREKIPDGQVSLRLEYDLEVRQVGTAIRVGGQVDNFDPIRIG